MSRLSSLPHHVSLIHPPFTLQSFVHSFADHIDPYFEYDRVPNLKQLSSPRFNVTETETEYLLDGEVPGVTEKNSVSVEWLQNQVLIISGIIKPSDTETATDPFESGKLKNDLPPLKEHVDAPPMPEQKMDIEIQTEKSRAVFPRQLLRERRIGPFQRSFTFPDEVDSDNMKASLSGGLLRIVVPKKANPLISSKRIEIH